MFSAGWHATVVRHILARLQLMPDMHRAISSLHHHRRLRGRAAYHHRRRKTLHGSGEKRQPDNDDFEEGFHPGECSIRRLPVSRRQSHNSMVLGTGLFLGNFPQGAEYIVERHLAVAYETGNFCHCTNG